MIPFASQRGGGQDLATHLLNAYDNEATELDQLRGAVAPDLHGAFKEWEVQADTLTRCRKYLYSLSINPDPKQRELSRDEYMDYIARAEEMLGLKDQPRAIVFHTKYGREHCHVVWSRINADQQKAVHLAFDHDKLMRVTRAFARDHGLTLPKGYDKSRQVGQITLYEQEQLRQTGMSKADHMRQVTEAWRQSDDARSFVQALAERGYLLATGKRPYNLVDLYGGLNSLPKLIDDPAVRTAELRAFLDKDFPVESLPTVEEAERLVAEHRKLIERSLNEDRYATRLADLKHSQQDRRRAVERERDALGNDQIQARADQQRRHGAQLRELRDGHMKALREVRSQRSRDAPTGLAAFLGRVSGVSLIRRTIHRYEDSRRLSSHREERAALKANQQVEARALALRLDLQTKEVGRRLGALEKVERRELAAFLRDERTDQRIRDRGGEDRLPSLAPLVEKRAGVERPPDLLDAFSRHRQQGPSEAPDLMRAFRRAASAGGEEGSSDGARTPSDDHRPPEPPLSRDSERNR